MGALFNRIKNFTATEDLTNTDLNAEFDNILNNLDADKIDDFSETVVEMQQTVDPGEVGTESLATSVAGEFERLRFVLKELSGEDQWYQTPVSSILDLANALGGGLPQNRIVSGRSRSDSAQPLFLVPDGSVATVTVKGATTNFVYVVDGTQVTINTDLDTTSLVLAPSANNTCLIDDAALADDERTKLLGEYGTTITVDAMGSEIISLTGDLAGFKIDNGGSVEYFIAKVNSSTQLTNAIRGFHFDSTDLPIPRIPFSNNDTITLMELTWIFATSTGTIALTFTNPRWSKDEPTSPSVGDYWFDMENNTWKVFNSTAFVAANATLIGISLQDDTATVAARSFDFFRSLDEFDNVEIEKLSSSEIRSKVIGQSISVYGAEQKFDKDFIRWVMPTDLESGSEASDTTYFLYVTELGEAVISVEAPHDRPDRKGRYHSHHTWRAVGEVRNDSASDFKEVSCYKNLDDESFKIVPSVAASALTFTLKNKNEDDPTVTVPLKVNFRTDTAEDADKVERTLIGEAVAVTVPSGATLGHRDAVNGPINLFMLDNAGVLEMAFTSGFADEGTLQTTILADGTSDDAKLYAAAVHVDKAIKRIARFKSNQTTAGTWAAIPTEAVLKPYENKLISIKYSSNSGQNITIAGNIFIYEDIDWDEFGIYDSSTGIGTFPFTGKWQIRAMVTTAASATSMVLRIRKNSTTVAETNEDINQISINTLDVATIVDAVTDDTFDVFVDGSSTITSRTDGAVNYIEVIFLGDLA